MSATDVVGIAVTTFILGSIYGLVAIGMTLIYGALRILDMSQGSMVMIGSFVGWGVLVVARRSALVAILLAMAARIQRGACRQLVSGDLLNQRPENSEF